MCIGEFQEGHIGHQAKYLFIHIGEWLDKKCQKSVENKKSNYRIMYPLKTTCGNHQLAKVSYNISNYYISNR